MAEEQKRLDQRFPVTGRTSLRVVVLLETRLSWRWPHVQCLGFKTV